VRLGELAETPAPVSSGEAEGAAANPDAAATTSKVASEVLTASAPEASAAMAEASAPVITAAAETPTAVEPPLVVAAPPVIEASSVAEVPVSPAAAAAAEEVVVDVPAALDLVESAPQPTATPAVNVRSELVMIETNTDKAQSWQAEEVTESMTARKPRRKPATVAVADEPLVMVETQK